MTETETIQNLTDKQLYRIKYKQEHKEEIKAYKNECQYCLYARAHITEKTNTDMIKQ